MMMFQSKAGPVLFAIHLGYGVGALIAPKVVVAFLTTSNLTSAMGPMTNATIKDFSNATSFHWNSSGSPPGVIVGHSNAVLVYPYAIATVFAGVLAISFLVLFLVNHFGKYYDHAPLGVESQKSVKGMLKLLSPGTCTDGKPIYGVIFISLFALLLFNIDGVDTAFRQFLYSFAINSYNVGSPGQASNLNLIYWVSFTVGRIISMILSMKIPIPYILGTVVTLSLVNSIVLDVLGKTHYHVILICTSIFGILNSSLVPACFLFSNYYIRMTGVAVGLGWVFAGAGTMVYIWLTGYLFNLNGPWACLFIALLGNSAVAINYFVLQVVACFNGKKAVESNK